MKNNRLWIALAAAIFLASAAASAWVLLRPKGDEVEIISDGKVICTIDLGRERDREMTVEYEGRENLIVIENGDIYVSRADCPDHICIKTGRLSESGAPIVCLPNHLMIRYKNGGDEADAAAG